FERPPIAQSPLSEVLPARNAEARVEKVLGNWVAYLDSLGREYELLLVNDGSTDRTGELAAAWGAPCPHFRLLEHASCQGVGAALRTGLAAARFPLLFYGECSNAYRPDDLGRLFEAIDNVDLVSGYRVCQAGRERPLPSPLLRRCLLRFLFGLRLRDADCA